MGLAPASGSVRLGDRELLGRRPEDVARSGIALVPEGRRIFAELTVEENLRLGLAARRGRGEPDYAWRVRALPGRARVPRRARRACSPAASNSSSRSPARSSREPDVLLLDEPSLGLAPSVVDVVFGALADDQGARPRRAARRAARTANGRGAQTAATCWRTACSVSRSRRAKRATPTSSWRRTSRDARDPEHRLADARRRARARRDLRADGGRDRAGVRRPCGSSTSPTASS